MIRVLHIINGASMGGISSMILNYYRCMDRSKVHFDFVTSCENGYNGWELEKLGSKFYFIEMKSKGLWNHVKELDKLMKKEHFDAIHVHSNHTSYVALMVAWKNHIKVRIAHGHNAVKSKPTLKGRISRRVGIILIRIFSTKRLACSIDSAIYTFGKHSLNEKNMEVLPNAIDVEKFRYDPVNRIKYRKEFGLAEDTIVVGCVGRMSQEKNHQFLLHVFASVLNINPDSVLILVGEGPEKSRLEELALTLKISGRVIFTGERTDIPTLLNAFDVLVMPSIFEGFPIAGIEALSNGLPLVLSDTITWELSFTDYTTYISLQESYEHWAKIICEQNIKRHMPSQADIVKDKGYDIYLAAKKLEQYYLG